MTDSHHSYTPGDLFLRGPHAQTSCIDSPQEITMLAMQYEHRLPADYDMQVIRGARRARG